jgi:GGDEF domain-containing protein
MTADRLSVLQAAVRRTRHVLTAHGLAPPPPAAETGPFSVILLCRGGRLGKLAAAVGPKSETLCALSVSVAIEFLLSGTYDVLVIDAESLGADAQTAVGEVRRHTSLSDVPILIVTSSGTAFAAQGVTARVALPDLSARLHEVANAARHVGQLRRELRELKRHVVGHTASGLSNRNAFTAHIAYALGNAEAPVAIGVMRMRMPGDGAAPPAIVSRPIAALLGTVTRAEDVIAEIAPGTFALLFPGAQPHDAERVVARLAAVVENSALLAADGSVVQPKVDHAEVAIAGMASVDAVWHSLEEKLAAAHSA